ncbi:winged helix-turn-helix transcriptional regulator [Georgenia yuyongxinii]|uniref:Helix-turn-helix transcriptional regulator n=1 Tax=Georgenia yuyongxinii TaxID=2589797 RepID=A0A552WV35_9MICO|nr:helix-turn-helix domain-containing protein [Georgenia yuyongxinii]TRW46607.1 helix-turn-helix transcriptional regulator [Georgenia yuyongxinii]
MAPRSYGQYCGVVAALDLVGERWALLIVRDLLVGPRRYTDLQRGLPRIPTNILATRLKELQAGGVIHRVPLAHGLVYELTPFGRELEDVVLALGRWGFKAMGEPDPADVVTADSMTIAFRTAFRPEASTGQRPTTYEVHIGTIVLALEVADGVLQVTPAPHPGAGVTFATGPGIRSLIAGQLSPTEAVGRGIVHVLDGDPALLDRFAQTFHLAADQAREPVGTLA